MRTTALALATAALLVMGGCKNEGRYTASSNGTSTATTAASSASATTSDPDQLGRIGAEIRKHPHDANKILSDHGMTEASFEKAIRSVSSDPAASRRYRDAYHKAGA